MSKSESLPTSLLVPVAATIDQVERLVERATYNRSAGRFMTPVIAPRIKYSTSLQIVYTIRSAWT